MCYQYYRRMLLRFGQQLIAYRAAVFIVTVVVAISPHLRIVQTNSVDDVFCKWVWLRVSDRFCRFLSCWNSPICGRIPNHTQSWSVPEGLAIAGTCDARPPAEREAGVRDLDLYPPHECVQLDDDHVYWPIAGLRRWLPQPRGGFWISCSTCQATVSILLPFRLFQLFIP